MAVFTDWKVPPIASRATLTDSTGLPASTPMSFSAPESLRGRTVSVQEASSSLNRTPSRLDAAAASESDLAK